MGGSKRGGGGAVPKLHTAGKNVACVCADVLHFMY